MIIFKKKLTILIKKSKDLSKKIKFIAKSILVINIKLNNWIRKKNKKLIT